MKASSGKRLALFAPLGFPALGHAGTRSLATSSLQRAMEPSAVRQYEKTSKREQNATILLSWISRRQTCEK
jgi:hypothetical protein